MGNKIACPECLELNDESESICHKCLEPLPERENNA